MDNPLDLKLLMNQTTNVLSSCTSTPITSIIKVYKCDNCHANFTDKSMFDVHKLSHLKETTAFVSAKDQPHIVQIIMAPSNQIHSQPMPAHQTTHMPITLQEQDLTIFKKTYGIEPQQIFTLAPVSNYQIISGNNRSITVSGSQDNQANLSTYATPTYIVAATPDGHQLQPLSEIIQQHESLTAHDLQGQIIEVSPQVPVEIQVNSAPIATHRQNRLMSIKDRPFKCDQCTASFLDSQELEEHKKKHTGDGPFTCEDCHFTFMYKSHFKSHKTRCIKKRASLAKPAILTGSPMKVVKRQFPTNKIIKVENRILNVPVSSPPYVALPPAQTIVSTIRNQARQVSSKQPAPIKFNPNNPSFKRVKKDIRLDRPFECDECDASFQSETDLSSHCTKHTGDGPFKCDECKFVFLYRKLYEAHKRRCDKKKKMSSEVVVMESHHTQYVTPISTNRIYSSQSQGSSQIHVTDAGTIDVSTMQLVQPSMMELRPVGSDGHEINHQPIIEQVIVTQRNEGQQEYKFEVIPSMDGVNVNQIVNLIKVKNQQ